MKRAIVLAIAALAACQQPAQRAQQPQLKIKDELKIGSKIADIHIVATAKLPANPYHGPVDEDCSGFVVEHPKSAGGQLVVRSGWIVTSETKLGSYDTVTFVGALKRAWILGTCAHVNGNLGVFEGSRLKAIAYELKRPRPADPTEGVEVEDSLGPAKQIDEHRIRLYYGLPLPPFADVVRDDGIFIEETAKADPVCGGAASVPNIFGQEIRKARLRLRAFGWLPVPSSAESGGLVAELRRQGVIEADDCQGTGYGFCAFGYEHKKGFRLGIFTEDDPPQVLHYTVSCSGSKRAGSHPKK